MRPDNIVTCARCAKRGSCTGICAEVERLLEKRIRDREYISVEFTDKSLSDPQKWPEPNKSTENLILEFFINDNFPTGVIATKLGVSRQYVRRVLGKAQDVFDARREKLKCKRVK